MKRYLVYVRAERPLHPEAPGRVAEYHGQHTAPDAAGALAQALTHFEQLGLADAHLARAEVRYLWPIAPVELPA